MNSITELRIKNGYTQEALAEKLHIDRSFLSKIEHGVKGVSVDLLIQISQLFNVSLDYIALGTITSQEEMLRARCDEFATELINQLDAFKKSL